MIVCRLTELLVSRKRESGDYREVGARFNFLVGFPRWKFAVRNCRQAGLSHVGQSHVTRLWITPDLMTSIPDKQSRAK